MSEVNAKESAMMRVSTFCVASSTLAVFALSAVAYAGGVVTPQVPVPHVSVPHIATPQVKTGGTINSTSAHITVKVPPVRHLSKGNITEKTDNSSRANKNNKAQSLINANIQQTKDSIQSAKDEAADAKASFETNIIMPSSSIIPSSQSIVRIAPLTRVVPFLHLPSPLPSGLQQGDPAEAAVVVILMMVQDGGKNLNQQMLAAEAQMAAKQSLRNLINNYDRPPPAADLYQAMGAGGSTYGGSVPVAVGPGFFNVQTSGGNTSSGSTYGGDFSSIFPVAVGPGTVNVPTFGASTSGGIFPVAVGPGTVNVPTFGGSIVPFLHLPSPLPSGLQQGDPAEAAVVVILMMVQDGGKNLNQQMLAAEAQMAAKQSLRNLINNYDRPPPAADLYQAMGAGTVSPKPVRYKGDPKSLGWYNGGAKGFGGYNAAVPCGTPCISVTVPTAVGGTSAMGDMGPPEIRALRNKLLNSASDIEKSTSDTDMAITGNIKQ
jgi:hypothetical protein